MKEIGSYSDIQTIKKIYKISQYSRENICVGGLQLEGLQH